MWLIDGFLIVFGRQWSSRTQRNTLYQALATQVVSRTNLFLVDIFANNKKHIDFHPTYPLKFKAPITFWRCNWFKFYLLYLSLCVVHAVRERYRLILSFYALVFVVPFANILVL